MTDTVIGSDFFRLFPLPFQN